MEKIFQVGLTFTYIEKVGRTELGMISHSLYHQPEMNRRLWGTLISEEVVVQRMYYDFFFFFIAVIIMRGHIPTDGMLQGYPSGLHYISSNTYMNMTTLENLPNCRLII